MTNDGLFGALDRLVGLLMWLTFFTFLTLKLITTSVVYDWSWWWVTSPLWLTFGTYLVVGLIRGIVEVSQDIRSERKSKRSYTK